MNSTIRLLALAVAMLGMGITLPNCPGQQAIQQQIDTLQQNSTDLKKTVQTIATQVGAQKADSEQVKKLLEQMTKAIEAQKTALEQLDVAVKSIQAKQTMLDRPHSLPYKKKGTSAKYRH